MNEADLELLRQWYALAEKALKSEKDKERFMEIDKRCRKAFGNVIPKLPKKEKK